MSITSLVSAGGVNGSDLVCFVLKSDYETLSASQGGFSAWTDAPVIPQPAAPDVRNIVGFSSSAGTVFATANDGTLWSITFTLFFSPTWGSWVQLLTP